ncbi:hypothetical protein WN944_006021 [Citrus x changshan-huyou]|uniref:Uncharacterized protein n=1 Tax=Citrus x changshan-huyou TaxID=2935761 RepID=A0AAP0QT42_9ROSI
MADSGREEGAKLLYSTAIMMLQTLSKVFQSWKNKYFVVGGNWGRDVELTKGWFKVPTHFSRPRNMSTAKCTPTEIAKALIEEISDEEGEPHSKKPRRASQKNKANEKKEKQHAVQLATCYLRAKVTELATLVPCAFYDLPLPQYV